MAGRQTRGDFNDMTVSHAVTLDWPTSLLELDRPSVH